MKNVADLVPKNKFDLSGREALKLLSDEEIAPILPELLAWMKDMNWPVAREMPELLAPHGEAAVSCIVEALRPEQPECDWKYYIIKDLLPLLREETLCRIRPCLERIAANPTREEREEEADVGATELLMRMDRENG
ncbi:MAG: DUF5071 domain-containing protein [Roseburia sp.]|nr:DUF5071 domain-containing protein [Roseburia sp.]